MSIELDTPHPATTAQYHTPFKRAVRSFGSFAIASSTASALTGIVTTYGFLLQTAGLLGIWMWVFSTLGRLVVATIVALLVARMPLTGFIYQWTSKLAHPIAGWYFGWLYFTSLPIIVLATDFGLITQAVFPPIRNHADPGRNGDGGHYRARCPSPYRDPLNETRQFR